MIIQSKNIFLISIQKNIFLIRLKNIYTEFFEKKQSGRVKKTKNSFIQSNLKKWIKKLSNDFLIKANFLIRFLNFLEKLVHCTRKLQPIFLVDQEQAVCGELPEIKKIRIQSMLRTLALFRVGHR